MARGANRMPPMPQRLNASTPWCFGASTPWRLDALTLWRLDSSCLDTRLPLIWVDAIMMNCRGVQKMAVRNYNTDGATTVVVQHMNTGEQAPLLQLKSWIDRHTTDMPGCPSCRAWMCFSLCSCILQATSVYICSLIGLVIPWRITPLQFGPRCRT